MLRPLNFPDATGEIVDLFGAFKTNVQDIHASEAEHVLHRI